MDIQRSPLVRRELAIYQPKLEIWGRTQREAARRRKSDLGKSLGGEFSLAAKSLCPNSNTLACALQNTHCRLRVDKR